MEWSRRLGIWLARLIELSRPAVDDLQPYTQRVRHLGRPISVLDLDGLRATKQTTRARDAEDLQHIEAALAALQGEVSEHDPADRGTGR